jgi:cobalt transporter subunit CbtB
MIRSHTASADARIGDRAAAALIAALLGSFMVFAVGFSTISAVHNAAHDSRHSFAFPCH